MTAAPQSGVRPRQGGGFNQGFGNFSDEHLDENAMQAAMQQKSLTQQSTASNQSTTGGSALGSHTPGTGPITPPAGQPPPPPREVSSIPDELIKRPAQDIMKGLASFLDINTLLGINPKVDDPQTQARKKQTLSRWQKLNEEQQEVAQRLYQKKMQQKQQEEQEAQAKKQQAEQQRAQTLVMPSSPQKGPIGPGSKKPAAVQKLEQDRKSLGGPQNVG